MINETTKQNLIEMNSQSSGEPAVEECIDCGWKLSADSILLKLLGIWG